MKRLPRNPEVFESFGLFAQLLRDRGIALTDPTSRATFLEMVDRGLTTALADPKVIHGRRVEAMFAYVTAALGGCRAIKEEDAGELYAAEDILPPDFRVRPKEGEEFLVEVKSFRPSNAMLSFSMKNRYRQRLLRYSDVFGRELKLAVHWSRWNVWTLVPVSKIPREGDRHVLPLTEAFKLNEMGLLGDLFIGTKPPLILRRYPAEGERPGRDASGAVTFTIGRGVLLDSENCMNLDSSRRS